MTKDQSTQAAQEKVCGYEYTVRRGDSFYLIANRLGVPLRDLLEANSDINPARLMVGDVLCIPMEEDDHPQPTVPQTPVPQTPSQPQTPTQTPPSDTPAQPEQDDLDAPAQPEQTPASPDDMVQDDAIFVCPQGSRHVVAQGETASDILLRHNINLYTLQIANPTTDLHRLAAGQVLCIPEVSVACPAPSTYILQTDETLESAALRLNASLSALLHANPCLAPSDFRAGTCINIPVP